MMLLKKMCELPLLCLSLFAILFLANPSPAQIRYFDLTKPYLRKIPMAVPVFQAATPTQAELDQAVAVADSVQKMLEFTGYFKILDRVSFLYNPQASGITLDKLNFPNWTTVGAELLVTGGVKVAGQEMVLELRLFDTFKAKLLVGRRYSGKIKDQRTIVRRFCAEVIQALTGNTGIFDSRLAFVSNGNGNKEIYICDFDGTNVRQVTKKRTITGFPAWSSDNQYLAYTSFANGPARIYIRKLKTGTENHVRYKGLQTAPSWKPGRFELSATLNFGGDEEIYLLTGKGKMIKRLTNSRGIDVEASWSPDGKKMAFVSNRTGSPQIYIKEVDTGRVQRITYKGKYNTQPCWSPKGDMIAYSSMENGRQNIFIIDIDGNHPIQLTFNQGDNEAPSWSPDGSLIAFSSNREGRSRIYVMTAYGTDQRRLLTLPGQQFQPKWSPNIPQ